MGAAVQEDRVRILVIEDEWMLAHAIADAIQRLGHEAVGPSGRLGEAMTLAKHESLDGAVLDLNLRGEMTFPIAKILTERGLPFIFLTGYDPHSVPGEYAKVPVLEKPFTDADLVANLLSLTGRGVDG